MILDLHIHSSNSVDSLATPESIVITARKREIDCIAITDHGTIKGGLEGKRFSSDGNPIVIVGAEMATDRGDIIGLFLNEEIRSGDWGEVIDRIHAQGGIAILPHPFKSHKLGDDHLSKVDLVEAFNSRVGPEKNNQALELAKKKGKPTVAGSDAHFCSEIGRGRTIMEGGQDLRKALLRGGRVEGEYSSQCMETISQFVKSARTRSYSDIPKCIVASVVTPAIARRRKKPLTF